MKTTACATLAALFISSYTLGAETQTVDTTYIKASKELPKVLYVVPWKDVNNREESEQKLVLHNFFGDLYDPVLPDQMQLSQTDNTVRELAK